MRKNPYHQTGDGKCPRILTDEEPDEYMGIVLSLCAAATNNLQIALCTNLTALWLNGKMDT